jgi:hypothetical protein
VVAAAGLLLWIFSHTTGCYAPRPNLEVGSAATNATDSTTVLPHRAITARLQDIDTQMPLEMANERAIDELRLADLPERFLPAEQLAIAAVQNLQAGHATDAAVWLSLASYRYHQAWYRILKSPIDRLSKRELDVYQELNFEPELNALGQLLRGEEMVKWDTRARLAGIFGDDGADSEAIAEAVRRKLVLRGGLAVELTTARKLSQAYLQHLSAKSVQKSSLGSATRALVSTPLAEYSLEALRSGVDRLSPGHCSIVANQLSTDKRAVVALLAAPKSEVRANAAVLLGMTPDPAQITHLEQRLASEQDTVVRLALNYALVRHGQEHRVSDLTRALAQCPTGVCEDAVTLLQWLPNDPKVGLDPELLLRLASDVRQRLFVRLSAIAILGDIGRKKPLSPRMREVLLATAQETNPDLLRYATEALKKDVGFSRELVLAALTKPTPAFVPLLSRLVRIATVEDLPMLRQLMPNFAAKPGQETDALIEAAARLPGADAEAQLVNWFDAHPSLRRRIAMRLMIRPNLEQATLTHLATATDSDVRLLVSVLGRKPDALALLQEALRASKPQQRLFAAYLAGLVYEPRVMEDLWSLVDFRDAQLYPDDARMRHTALSSLLFIALDKMVATRAFEATPAATSTVQLADGAEE